MWVSLFLLPADLAHFLVTSKDILGTKQRKAAWVQLFYILFDQRTLLECSMRMSSCSPWMLEKIEEVLPCRL